MQIPRSRLVEHLRAQGEHDRAAQAGLGDGKGGLAGGLGGAVR